MSEWLSDPQIQGALIGAGATIAVGLPGLIAFLKKYANLKKLVNLLRGELAQSKEIKTDAQIVRQNFVVTFDKDGKHSVVRRDCVRHVSGTLPVKSKKIAWATDSFDGYLEKVGKQETEIDFDKEFSIKVYDITAQAYLTPTTIRQRGADYDTLATTFVFDNPLDEQHPDLEYEIRYKLDPSFSFRTLWQQQNDFWITGCSDLLEELHIELLFPADLPPDKWRTGNFGLPLTPAGWANISQDTDQQKRRIVITARNLPAGEYRARIDARV